jgi:putative drug exporter of the RND superfamily
VTRLTRWVLSHQLLVVTAWVVLTVAGAAAAGPASRALTQQYTAPGSEASRANTQMTRIYGNGGGGSALVTVVTVPNGMTVGSSQVRAQLAVLDRRVEATLPGARVASFATTGSSTFVSPDRRTAFGLVYPKPEPGSFGQSPAAASRLARALQGATVAGAPVHLTGLEALSNQAGQGRGPGVFVEVVLGAVGALAVLVFVFASLLAFVPLAMAACSILTTFLCVWALTAITNVSNIVEFLIALVGLGVAIDYALLIVIRWREERAHGHQGEEAVIRAMSTAGRAVVLSGTTVAVGLLALVVLPFPFLRSIGYGGLLIPLVSVLVALTLLPIVLLRAGNRLDWPHRRTDENASRLWSGWARGVIRLRWAATIAALVILGGLIGAAFTMNLGTDNPNAVATSGAARAGLTQLERSGIGAGPLTPTEILTTAGRADAVVSAVGTVDGVRGAVAPAASDWRRAGTAIVDVISPHDGSTSAGRAVVGPVRAAAHATDPASLVGGPVAAAQAFIDGVYGNFPLMIAIIAVLTFVLLARAFRSILLPVKAVILNIVSVAAAWGALTLIWQHGYGSKQIWGIASTGAIPEWIPVIMFAFLFGLSMDYEVFILARMRETVVGGIGRTGRLVTSAALILFLSFVALASAPNTDIKMLATGLAVGILLDATVIRALLLPAIVSLFGRWNWWLPSIPARLLRVRPSIPASEH